MQCKNEVDLGNFFFNLRFHGLQLCCTRIHAKLEHPKAELRLHSSHYSKRLAREDCRNRTDLNPSIAELVTIIQ